MLSKFDNHVTYTNCILFTSSRLIEIHIQIIDSLMPCLEPSNRTGIGPICKIGALQFHFTCLVLVRKGDSKKLRSSI